MTPSPAESLPENILMILAEIRAGLDAQAQDFGTLLRRIRLDLQKAPELVHIMSDEQLNAYFEARKRTYLVNITPTLKASSKKAEAAEKKALKNLGVNDFD